MMSDERVVDFKHKRPSKRPVDIRDEIIVAMHRHAVALDELVRTWEKWGDDIVADLKKARDLADAEGWDELRAFLQSIAARNDRAPKLGPLWTPKRR